MPEIVHLKGRRNRRERKRINEKKCPCNSIHIIFSLLLLYYSVITTENPLHHCVTLIALKSVLQKVTKDIINTNSCNMRFHTTAISHLSISAHDVGCFRICDEADLGSTVSIEIVILRLEKREKIGGERRGKGNRKVVM